MVGIAQVYRSKHPRYPFELRYTDPARREPSGRLRRITRYFKSEENATKAAAELNRNLKVSGTVGVHLDAAMRAEYIAARQILDMAGWIDLSLSELARDFTIRTKRLAAHDTPVGPLAEEFLRVKREDENRSRRWVATLHTRVHRWMNDQAIATLADITREKVMPLRSRPGVAARTRQGDMIAVSTFLNWLVTEKWLQENPLSSIAKPSVDAAAPRVLTAVQTRALLDAARTLGEGRLLRYFALAIFAGLRPSEIETLPEDRIRLTRTSPVVRVIGGKRRQRVRVVPILPTLRAWLKIAPKHQPIADFAKRDRLLYDEVRQASGLVAWEGALRGRRRTLHTSWQNDICRHTFISLRMAMTHDENRVALEAGNTPNIIHAHYLSMIDSAEMRALLAVRPR